MKQKKISLTEHLGCGALHGADYNPEQWNFDEDILKEDFSHMRKTSCTSMSVGIFSWSLYEPREGEYHFDWMAKLLDRMHQEGIKAFLATPSGSKPMWMACEHPEVRRVNIDGLRDTPGGRHNHCLSSTYYMEKVYELNEKLAQNFGNHPALALWHLGNELSGECYCDSCLDSFRKWLQQKYETLENLNELWWCKFWNHTFSDWSQIDPRYNSIDGLTLDWMRFVNDLHVEFLKNEIAPLKKHSPDIPVTTNFMGFHQSLKYNQWAEILDVVSNDTYPILDGGPTMDKQSIGISMTHDLMRGMNEGKPWMLMECSPSLVNWVEINKLKPNGVHPLEASLAVAHGADTIHYFQWRKCRAGYEKYHGAVVDHDSRDDTRVFKEVVKTGDFLSQLKDIVSIPVNASEVAMVYDWDSQWAMSRSAGVDKQVPQTGPIPTSGIYHDILRKHYAAAKTCGLSVDFLFPSDDGIIEGLEKYKVAMIPALYLVQQSTIDQLVKFTENGGVLIMSHLTGVVDEYNRIWRGGLPAMSLHKAAGVKVEELDKLVGGESQNVLSDFSKSASYEISKSFGMLKMEGATEYVALSEGSWKGMPVVTSNAFGKGKVWMIAGLFNDEFYADLMSKLKMDESLTPVLDSEIDDGILVTERSDNDTTYYFIINTTAGKKSLNLQDSSFMNLDGTQLNSSDTILEPFETLVLLSRI